MCVADDVDKKLVMEYSIDHNNADEVAMQCRRGIYTDLGDPQF